MLLMLLPHTGLVLEILLCLFNVLFNVCFVTLEEHDCLWKAMLYSVLRSVMCQYLAFSGQSTNRCILFFFFWFCNI